MFRLFYAKLILLGCIAVTSQRYVSSNNKLKKIDRLLHGLDDKGQDGHRDDHHHVRDRHHQHPHDHKDLMNIQTLNLIIRNGLKNRNQKPDPATEPLKNKLDLALRYDDDDSCGCDSDFERCGCGGRGRSGLNHDSTEELSYVNQKQSPSNPSLKYLLQHGKRYRVSDDLDAVVVDVSHLEKLLNENKRDQEQEYLEHVYQPKRYDDDSEETLKRTLYDILALSNGKSIKVIKCSGTKCAVLDRSNESDAEYRNNHLDDLQALVKLGKKYKIDDNVDAVVVNVDDLDHLYTRNKDRKFPLGKERNLLNQNSVLLDLDKIQTADNYNIDGDSAGLLANKEVSEHDEYYTLADLKQRLVDDVVDYVKGKRAGIVYNYLTDKQKKVVNYLKRQLRQTGRPNIRTLNNRVNGILFQEDSSETKIKNEKTKKRALSIAALPLRRNDRVPTGIPFELQLQGLGQVNP